VWWKHCEMGGAMGVLKTIGRTVLAPVGALLLLWVVSAVVVRNTRVIPSPRHVLTESLPEFGLMGVNSRSSYRDAVAVINEHLAPTVEHAVIGWIIGALLGGAVGLVLGACKLVGGDNRPVPALWLKNLPLFAFIPLFLCWFSARSTTVIAYVAFATTMIILPGAALAAARSPRNQIDLAQSAGLGYVGLFARVIVPSAWPRLVPTLRWTVLLIWAFSLGAEYAGSARKGIGVLAYQSYLWSDVGRMWVVVIVYLLLGSLSALVFDLIMLSLSRFAPKPVSQYKESLS